MTINDAITRVDDLKANQYSDENKIAWLSELEHRIYKEIFMIHEGDPTLTTETDELGNTTTSIGFFGYDVNIDYDTELLVPDPYSDVYIQYMISRIDYYNDEQERYMNSAAMFNTTFNDFAAYWNRTHKHLLSRPIILF